MMGESMNNSIKVSVIVPVYNVAKYLEKCILSLVNQSLKDLEIICVDDGSTDGCSAILDRLATSDKRIRVVHKCNAGVSAARNDAIKLARGDLISFVDSDDWVEPNLYQDVCAIADKMHADIVVFGGDVFSETTNTNNYLNDAFAFFKDNLNVKSATYVGNSVRALMDAKGSWPLIWNKIYKRELVLSTGGFDTTLALGEDEAFLFSIYPRAERIVYTDKKYYHYLRNRPNSATDIIVTDFERKAFSNLRMAKIVRNTWLELGILDIYSKDFLNRYVDLLFDNAKSLDFAEDEQKKFLQQVFAFFNEFPFFSKNMMEHWYEDLWLRGERERLQKEINDKQNEIWGLINSKNISDGQVAVLKEVAIARINSNIAVTDNKKNVGRKIKTKKEKPIKKTTGLLAGIKKFFNSESLHNINNIASKVYSDGYEFYMQLKRRYGSDCVFITCALAGIGDAYLVSCYIDDWLKKNNVTNFRFLLFGKSELKMVEALFPNLSDKCIKITQDQHEWLRNFSRLCDFKPDFYFFHHYDYMQPHLQFTEKLQGYKGLNMRDLYLWKMGLPKGTPCRQPSYPEGQDVEIDNLFKKYGLEKGRTVVIAPYSTCLGNLGESFWMPIVSDLKRKGYSVCTNCNGDQKPLLGTEGVFIEFKYILNFINAAGYFVGIRSGLCDVVSSCNAKMIVLHPYHSTQWGDGNSLKYVGIVNMGFNDGHNLTEFELKETNSDLIRIQGCITKLLNINDWRKNSNERNHCNNSRKGRQQKAQK